MPYRDWVEEELNRYSNAEERADIIDGHMVVCRNCGQVKEVFSRTLYRASQCLGCWCAEQNANFKEANNEH